LRNYQVVSASGGRLSDGSDREPAVGEADAAAGRPPSRAGLRQVGVHALPWLLVLGLASVALLQTSTPALDIIRYGAYWVFGVTLPGVLVARAASPRKPSRRRIE